MEKQKLLNVLRLQKHEQIDDIKKRIADLEVFLSIQEKKEFVAAEELKTQAVDFWDNPKSAETHLKNINKQKVWVVAFQEVQSAFDDLSRIICLTKNAKIYS